MSFRKSLRQEDSSSSSLSRLKLRLRKELPQGSIEQGNSKNPFWEGVLSTPSLCSPILELILNAFWLQPRTQWFEALRVQYLPNIPQRSKLLDDVLWNAVESAFEGKKFGEFEIYFAAWQLLFDSWLKVQGFYESESPPALGRLAEETSAIDVPPIRIAQCIRDIAYGHESRVADLKAMVRSEDPDYAAVFEKCFWREPRVKRRVPKPD